MPLLCVALCALLSSPSSSHAASSPSEALYFVRHSVTRELTQDEPLNHAGLYQVALLEEPKAGRSVRIRPLWIRHGIAPASDINTSALDPDNAEDRPALAVLQAGFASKISSSGEAGELQAVDAQASAALKKRDGDRAAQQLLLSQAPGVRPFVLPERLESGQQLPASLRVEPYGPFTAQLKVLELTPEAAVFSLRVDEKSIKGAGRVVVRLRDGMPIELRMQLDHSATRAAPASSHRVHVADMAYDPHLDMAEDLGNYQDYVGQIEQTLAGIPFNGTYDEARLYALNSLPPAELQAHMVGSDVLPGLERNMGFGWVPLGESGRSELALGARLSSRTGDEALLVARTGPVVALDADGERLDDLTLQTVMPQLYLGSHFSANEEQPNFPFRLPLGVPQSQRDRIHTFRMPVMAEVYQWHSVETIAAGAQSAVNAGLEVELGSPTRVTVRHQRGPQRQSVGFWTVVVPLDADGKEIASQQVAVLPIPLKQVTELAEVPLAWESREVPYRTEIAAEKPISQLQLRHYQWVLEPRVWDFRWLP